MYTEQEVYDQRQLKLMLNIINLCKNNKASSDYMLNSIEALSKCLHTKFNPEEDEKFFLLCANLEHDYLNLNNPNFPQQRKKQLPVEINEELEELIRLIESKIVLDDE